MKRIFFILSGLFLLFACTPKFNRFDDLQLKNFLVENNQYFDFSFINMFDWDEVYIVPPYTSRQKISDTIGLKFNYPITVHSTDVVNLLIFLNDNKVITYDEVPRHIVDFDILNMTLITPENPQIKIRY